MRKEVLITSSLIGSLVLVIGGPIILSNHYHNSSSSLLLTPSPVATLSYPINYDSLIQQGQKFYSQALASYRQHQDPEVILSLLNKAIDKYHQAIKLNPQRPQAYYQVGQLYDSVRGFYPKARTQAETAYRLAYSKDPSNPLYLNSLTYFLWQEHKYLEVKAYLEAGLKHQPTNTDGVLLLAKTYTQLGQVERAVQVLSQVKERLSPDDLALREEVDEQLTLLKKLLRAGDILAGRQEKSPFLSPTPLISPTPESGKHFNFSHLPLKEAMSSNLIIAEPKEKIQNILNEEKGNALVGQVVFPKQHQQIKVKNILVTPNSKIITVTEDRTNQTIFVKEKGNGQFTLASSGPLEKDIKVTYWIVN